MKFERLQDKLTKGQFVARRHYCITSKVYDFAKVAQFEAYKKDRTQCPTMADMYYQLIIEGLKHADKVTFQNLPKNHTVRIKLGKPINKQLFEVQGKIESEDFSSMRGYLKNGKMQTINIFSVAVCLMEAAIDNQKL
jgi:hypothetical protein